MDGSLGPNILLEKPFTDQEIEQTLTYIEEHLKTTDPLIQWTMNQCLVEIAAVTYPDYLEKGRAIGQKLGVYSEMKVAKGCTSAYAPDWIEAFILRKNENTKVANFLS